MDPTSCDVPAPRPDGAAVEGGPTPDAADRLVVLGPEGHWEVRAPGGDGVVLRSSSRAPALQWAWNITSDMGGRVILARPQGRQLPTPHLPGNDVHE